MTGKLDFKWTPQRFEHDVRDAAHEALDVTGDQAHEWWIVLVPVETGQLRDSWFAYVIDASNAAVLVFGAATPYVLYVEFGTGKMLPRAPIRATAAEIVPLVIPNFRSAYQRRAA